MLLQALNSSSAGTSSMLARKLHVRMAYPVMSGECVCTAECLLLSAEIASHLLLAGIVDGVLVASKVVWSGENRTARLASAWVDSITAMGTSLAVQ
jgi:hypothetical protein